MIRSLYSNRSTKISDKWCQIKLWAAFSFIVIFLIDKICTSFEKVFFKCLEPSEICVDFFKLFCSVSFVEFNTSWRETLRKLFPKICRGYAGKKMIFCNSIHKSLFHFFYEVSSLTHTIKHHQISKIYWPPDNSVFFFFLML